MHSSNLLPVIYGTPARQTAINKLLNEFYNTEMSFIAATKQLNRDLLHLQTLHKKLDLDQPILDLPAYDEQIYTNLIHYNEEIIQSPFVGNEFRNFAFFQLNKKIVIKEEQNLDFLNRLVMSFQNNSNTKNFTTFFSRLIVISQLTADLEGNKTYLLNTMAAIRKAYCINKKFINLNKHEKIKEVRSFFGYEDQDKIEEYLSLPDNKKNQPITNIEQNIIRGLDLPFQRGPRYPLMINEISQSSALIITEDHLLIDNYNFPTCLDNVMHKECIETYILTRYGFYHIYYDENNKLKHEWFNCPNLKDNFLKIEAISKNDEINGDMKKPHKMKHTTLSELAKLIEATGIDKKITMGKTDELQYTILKLARRYAQTAESINKMSDKTYSFEEREIYFRETVKNSDISSSTDFADACSPLNASADLNKAYQDLNNKTRRLKNCKANSSSSSSSKPSVINMFPADASMQASSMETTNALYDSVTDINAKLEEVERLLPVGEANDSQPLVDEDDIPQPEPVSREDINTQLGILDDIASKESNALRKYIIKELINSVKCEITDDNIEPIFDLLKDFSECLSALGTDRANKAKKLQEKNILNNTALQQNTEKYMLALLSNITQPYDSSLDQNRSIARNSESSIPTAAFSYRNNDQQEAILQGNPAKSLAELEEEAPLPPILEETDAPPPPPEITPQNVKSQIIKLQDIVNNESKSRALHTSVDKLIEIVNNIDINIDQNREQLFHLLNDYIEVLSVPNTDKIEALKINISNIPFSAIKELAPTLLSNIQITEDEIIVVFESTNQPQENTLQVNASSTPSALLAIDRTRITNEINGSIEALRTFCEPQVEAVKREYATTLIDLAEKIIADINSNSNESVKDKQLSILNEILRDGHAALNSLNQDLSINTESQEKATAAIQRLQATINSISKNAPENTIFNNKFTANKLSMKRVLLGLLCITTAFVLVALPIALAYFTGGVSLIALAVTKPLAITMFSTGGALLLGGTITTAIGASTFFKERKSIAATPQNSLATQPSKITP